MIFFQNRKIMIKTHNVRQTSVYSKFAFLPPGVNREVQPGHLATVADSVRKYGNTRNIIVALLPWLHPTLLYVLDGQHLLRVCEVFKIPVNYSTIKIKDMVELIECIAKHNTSSKSWVLADYVQSWSNIRDDYKVLKFWYDKYAIPYQGLAVIGMNKPRSSASERVREGRFTIVNKNSVKILDYIKDFLDILGKMKGSMKERIAVSFLEYYNNQIRYNHAKIVKRFKDHRKEIRGALTEDHLYSFLWGEIYQMKPPTSFGGTVSPVEPIPVEPISPVGKEFEPNNVLINN